MTEEKYINNPILRGFNPDPSIIRVNEDYYIATSTFEWFPGVQLHHSRDLVNWELLSRPLNRQSQLNMIGIPDSGGIWAPDISYKDGVFYLVFTNVICHKGMWRDMHNYVVTTEDIKGDWSEPVYLNSIGHDPSIFHDKNGKTWLLNVEWAYVNGKNIFDGIMIQEYSIEKKSLIGESHNIFKGTEFGLTEAPHLYYKDDYYYLLTAEGGTWYNHCATLARSKNLLGPYEVHPDNPFLTSMNNKNLALQKAGHGDLVETQNGEWFLVHLCGRPITPDRRCVLGRETAIQRIIWKDNGWPYIDNLSNEPNARILAPNLPEFKKQPDIEKDDFNKDKLEICYQTLRVPKNEDIVSLKKRRSFLRIKGMESLSSSHNQSMIARRVQSFNYRAETVIEFEPCSSRQMAGLVLYYNTENYYYLCVSYNQNTGKNLRIIKCNANQSEEPLGDGYGIVDKVMVGLKLETKGEKGQFYFSLNQKEWEKIGPSLDTSLLSDDYIGRKAFTGTFIGICCQDMSRSCKYADFDYFLYKELD